MNKIIIILVLFFASDLYAQEFQIFLKEVEGNNAALKSMRKQNEAQALQLKTTNTPENPEVEYGFFPGNTDAIGTKKVFGISQRFEFPGVYSSRRKYIAGQSRMLESEYQVQRRRILTEASKTILSYVYHHKALEMNRRRLRWNKALEADMRKRYEKGDLSVIEVKKASIQVVRLENEVRKLKSKLISDSLKIVELNGNQEPGPGLSNLDFPEIENLDKDQLIKKYVERHPEMHLQDAMVETSGKLVKLKKQEYLPDIRIGYESEQIMNNIHRGIKAGVEIPLWGNKHTIDAARMQQEATASRKEEIKYRHLKTAERKFQNWENAKEAYVKFNQALKDYNNPDLLREAHNKGYLNSIELFMELDYYYKLKDELLETRFETLKLQTELTSYEL